MRKVEPIHKDSVPVPYVTVVPTWEALQLWRTNRRTWNMEMSEGLALTMLDGRMNLEVCPSTEVNESWLKQPRVIALCGASGISDDQARLFTDWVKGGGGLLATYDTGLYDGNGQLRRGGALKEVLGVEIQGEPGDSQPDCYYRIKEAHPALGEYGPGAVVMGDSRLVPVEAAGGGRVLADCWNLGTNESRGPAIIANQYGKGRTIYVSGSLEANYPGSRVPSLRRLLASMVRYLAGDAPVPYTLSAPRGVYGQLRRAPNGELVLWLLANIGFKDAVIGRMRQEFVPISNVEVGILVPEGRQAKGMRLMRADQAISFRVEDGYAVATVPTLHIAEVVHLELA
jgi:hypothetical protein